MLSQMKSKKFNYQGSQYIQEPHPHGWAILDLFLKDEF